jgi:hypothetical protein
MASSLLPRETFRHEITRVGIAAFVPRVKVAKLLILLAEQAITNHLCIAVCKTAANAWQNAKESRTERWHGA